MDPLALTLLFAISLICLAGLGFLSYRYWQAGTCLCLLLFFIRAVYVTIPALDVGPINVFPDDVLFALLAAVAIGRLFKDLDLAVKRLPWLALGLICAVSLYLGVSKFGVKIAGNEARRFLYFYITTLYVSSFRLGPEAFRQFVKILNFVGLALVLLAGLRWAQSIVGIPLESQFLGRIDQNPEELPSPFRVLYHTEALFLCQILLINLWYVLRSGKSRVARIYLSLFFPAVVILQHRTVWVVLFVLGTWMALKNAKRTKAIPFLVGCLLVVSVLSVLMLATDHLGPVRDALVHSVDEPMHDDHSTFLWRVEGWRQLLDRSMTDLATGDPYGSGFTRIIQGLRVEYSPHNYYIETLLRLGMGGVALLLFVYVVLLWRCGKQEPAFAERRAFVFVLAAQLIYYLTYPASFEQGLLLGFCAAVTGGSVQPVRAWLRRPVFNPLMRSTAGAARARAIVSRG